MAARQQWGSSRGCLGRWVAPVIVVMALGQAARADVPEEAREGARLFDDSAYIEAADAFRQATIAAPDDPRWRYDLGLSEARGQDFESALNNLKTTAQMAPANIAAPAWFNAGNVHFASGDYAAAAQAYRQSLLLDAQDPDAKRNLELALKRLQEQQSESKEGESEDQNQDQNQGDQQQNPQDQQNQQDQQEQKQKQDQPQDDQSSDSDQKNQDPQSQQQQQQGETDSTLTREQAERILRALADEEARMRNQARRLQAIPAPGGKDW